MGPLHFEPHPLRGLRVVVSGAVPERSLWRQPDQDRSTLRFVAQLSGMVMKYGGVVVHGHEPSFTPVVRRQAERFAAEHPDPPPLILVGSRLWLRGLDEGLAAQYRPHASLVLTPQIGSGTPEDLDTRERSLTAMRLELLRYADVLVAVGGKFHEDIAVHPGILEELAIARWHGVPCFVISSLGGAAGRLRRDLVRIFSQDNLLSDESVAEIADWTESVETVAGRLLAHLLHHHSRLVRPVGRKLRASEASSTSHQVRLADADPQAIKLWSRRMREVHDAVDREDTATLRRLLVPEAGFGLG